MFERLRRAESIGRPIGSDAVPRIARNRQRSRAHSRQARTETQEKCTVTVICLSPQFGRWPLLPSIY